MKLMNFFPLLCPADLLGPGGKVEDDSAGARSGDGIVDRGGRGAENQEGQNHHPQQEGRIGEGQREGESLRVDLVPLFGRLLELFKTQDSAFRGLGSETRFHRWIMRYR